MNLIRHLGSERAAAFYRTRSEIRPLQVEAIRQMQDRADEAYDEAVTLYNAGRLRIRLSRDEAIGNYVDLAVRQRLTRFYNQYGIETSRTGPVRVVGREYDTSKPESSYRIPDNRVGKVAFDVTLTRKTLSTPQVQGFFNSDFQPDVVVIVRPRQLGPNHTYAITRPRK